MQSVSKVKSFFAAHKAARVLLVIAAALLAFVLIFHPHGTKTYLITGIDNYGSLNDNGRSDVMMLVQVGFDSGKIHAVTFARDIVVPNEHNKNVKLNTIVRMQDEDALVDTLERVFDLKIDGWFRVNFSSVITIIDAMGGVQLELTDAEARYINGREGEYPDYPLAEAEYVAVVAEDGTLGGIVVVADRSPDALKLIRRQKHEPCVALLPERRRTGEARL